MFKQRLVHFSTALALVVAPVMLSVPLSGWAQIEEIIVTARKREENLQEIPLAVKVFGREEILRKGINTIDQVALLSASLGYESAAHPEAQKLSIRGIAPSRGRQNVAILMTSLCRGIPADESRGRYACYRTKSWKTRGASTAIYPYR